MKYLKAIVSFYNNCVEIPKKDFERTFPRLAGLFYYLYFLVFLFDSLFFSSLLALFSRTLSELFGLFCLPIFVTLLAKMSYDDFTQK